MENTHVPGVMSIREFRRLLETVCTLLVEIRDRVTFDEMMVLCNDAQASELGLHVF